MTAAELLAQYGVTVEQARAFVLSNLDNPGLIFETAVQFGVTSSMLAEIVAPVVPGVTAEAVESFFSSRGFPAEQLREQPLAAGGGGLAGLPDALLALVSLNTSQGLLATASLRAAVLAALPNDSFYDVFFDPLEFGGYEDGLFTAAELGIPGLPAIAATRESLESLYYGTIIRTLKAIDESEVLALDAFVEQNYLAIEAGSATVYDQYVALVVSVLQDSAAVPFFSDDEIAEIITLSTVATVELVATGSVSLVDSLFSSFL